MTETTPVTIVDTKEPIPVIVKDNVATKLVNRIDALSLSPTTTQEQDINTANQRKINLIWEYTQSFIAIVVVLATMISGVIIITMNIQIPTIFSVAFGTVIGFYFSRTNHQAIGGIGQKPSQPYEGR